VKKIELFAGAGGGVLAGALLGHKTLAAVEIEPYCRLVHQARQNDGSLPSYTLWDDVVTYAPSVTADLVCGGFPCQDISAAGRGRGLEGPKSRLIWEMLRISTEVKANFIFAENSDRLRTKGLRQIVAELVRLGYGRIAWVTLGAAHVGAPHLRKRMWLLAKHGGTGHAGLPEDMPAHGVLRGGHVDALEGPGAARGVIPTLIRADAASSGNRPDPSLWSLSDVLGVTAKHARHGKMYPTPVRSDFKGHSGAGMERLMQLRSRPLRDVLPHEEGGTCINPLWAEWLMGWCPEWTDLKADCSGSLREWRELTRDGSWWTDPVEETVLPRTFAKRPAAYQDRIKALGNGQVPLCAAVAFTTLMDLVS
jgi:hypothetical protein